MKMSCRPLRWRELVILFALAQTGIAHAQSETQCGSLANAYGPFDYRTQANGAIKIVDDHHFTPEVEALISGSTGHIGGDLDYTLRASPNHHRALAALQRLAVKMKLPQIPDMRYTVDCYFERALRFQRDDAVARMILVLHLLATERVEQARSQLDYVVSVAKDNAFTHFNAGLLYVETKDYAKAREQAYVSASLGLNRSELRDRLVRAGEWIDPPAAAASKADASASAMGSPTASAPAGPGSNDK